MLSLQSEIAPAVVSSLASTLVWEHKPPPNRRSAPCGPTSPNPPLPPRRGISCPFGDALQEAEGIYDVPLFSTEFFRRQHEQLLSQHKQLLSSEGPELPPKLNKNLALAHTTADFSPAHSPRKSLDDQFSNGSLEDDEIYNYPICSAQYFQQQLEQLLARAPPLPAKRGHIDTDSAYGSTEDLKSDGTSEDILMDNRKQLSDLFSTRHITSQFEFVVFPVHASNSSGEPSPADEMASSPRSPPTRCRGPKPALKPKPGQKPLLVSDSNSKSSSPYDMPPSPRPTASFSAAYVSQCAPPARPPRPHVWPKPTLIMSGTNSKSTTPPYAVRATAASNYDVPPRQTSLPPSPPEKQPRDSNLSITSLEEEFLASGSNSNCAMSPYDIPRIHHDTSDYDTPPARQDIPSVPEKAGRGRRLSDFTLDDDVFLEGSPILGNAAQQSSTVDRFPTNERPVVPPKPKGYVRPVAKEDQFNGVDHPQGRRNALQPEATDVIEDPQNGPLADVDVVLRHPSTESDDTDGPIVVRVDGSPMVPLRRHLLQRQFQRGSSVHAIRHKVDSVEFRRPADWSPPARDKPLCEQPVNMNRNDGNPWRNFARKLNFLGLGKK